MWCPLSLTLNKKKEKQHWLEETEQVIPPCEGFTDIILMSSTESETPQFPIINIKHGWLVSKEKPALPIGVSWLGSVTQDMAACFLYQMDRRHLRTNLWNLWQQYQCLLNLSFVCARHYTIKCNHLTMPSVLLHIWSCLIMWVSASLWNRQSEGCVPASPLGYLVCVCSQLKYRKSVLTQFWNQLWYENPRSCSRQTED